MSTCFIFPLTYHLNVACALPTSNKPIGLGMMVSYSIINQMNAQILSQVNKEKELAFLTNFLFINKLFIFLLYNFQFYDNLSINFKTIQSIH